MNYKQIYNSLMERSRDRNLSGYSERHHIIPKCMGGSNRKYNIAILTAKEHYLAHFLLTRIYPNNIKLIYGFWVMCNGIVADRPNTNSRMYQIAKEMFSEVMKAREHYFKGKKHSKETLLKISAANKGNTYWLGKNHSEDTKKKLSIASSGRKHSDKTKLVMSKLKKGIKLSDSHKRNLSLAAKKGDDKPQSKLSWEKVREIRKLYREGKSSQHKLAKLYNVSRSAIKFVVQYRSWIE